MLNKDILINHTKSGSGGRLYNRIRYLKRSKIEKNTTTPTTSQDISRNASDSTNHLLWLKTIVVSDTNMEDIRKKLELTRADRDEMVLKDNIELLQEFPFFFTHPSFVSFVDLIYSCSIRSQMNNFKFSQLIIWRIFHITILIFLRT